MPTFGLVAESLPAEIAEDDVQPPAAPRSGPTPVTGVRILMDRLGLADWLEDCGILTFGWMEMGYTGASAGSGLLSVEPRLNRFGNEFLLNELAIVLQKPLQQDRFD